MVNISQIKNEPSDWNIILSSNGTLIFYKIDTGAQCNVMFVECLGNISLKPDLQPVIVKLPTYNGSNIPVVSKCSLTLANKSNYFKVSFIVVDSDSLRILGLKTSKHFQLTKRICTVETNSETFFSESHNCFGEIGTLNTTHHIEVKDNVKPVVAPVHKVPHALERKLEKELKRMVNLDIIEPMKNPTDWVKGHVITKKPNGKLHIFLAPRPLNKVIKHEHLHLPTAEEIFLQISGACFFSKLDASSRYRQIKVGEESSHLLVFATRLGRYRFKRLTYGIHSASKVFQREITSLISDVPRSANCLDDIIVLGRILAEYNERFKSFFEDWQKRTKTE